MTHPFDRLRIAAENHPDALAMKSIDAQMTYADLYDTALRFARVFRDNGIKPGDVVAVSAPAMVEITATEALFHEACIGTQVPHGFPEVHGETIDWVVTSSPVMGFPEHRQIILDQGFFNRTTLTKPVLDPIPYDSDESICRLSFSSGTTGRPKAVPATVAHTEDRAVVRHEQWLTDQPALCVLGLGTILGFVSLYFHIANAQTVYISGSAHDNLTLLNEQLIQCLIASPHQLGELLKIAEAEQRGFGAITSVVTAGSVLPEFIANEFENKHGVAVWSVYGSTEAGGSARRRGSGASDGWLGTLWPEIDAVITDEHGNALADGEVGLIGLRRPHQSMEYFKDPVSSAQAFRDGYFFSGDMGYLKDRDLYLAGRQDEIINAAGVKVDPAKVEAVAFDFLGIDDAAVFSHIGRDGLQAITLAFVSESDIAIGDFHAFMRSRLGEVAPGQYLRVSEIPRNDMGKVNREELSHLFAE